VAISGSWDLKLGTHPLLSKVDKNEPQEGWSEEDTISSKR